MTALVAASAPLPLFGSDAGGSSPPLVLSYGMGVDSTAVLIGWRCLGRRPDLIMFADVGSEHDSTYRYRAVIDDWLAAVGFPALTVVRYRPRHGRYTTLVEDCLVKGVLPSLAYGSKACSQKWKVEPQNAFLRRWRPAIAAWSYGQRLEHAIGYDAGPKDMRRGGDCADTALERFTYPLREWGWCRDRCKAEIASDELLSAIAGRHGIPAVPTKSACICCPSTQPHEVDEMAAREPVGLAAALAVEAAALPTLKTLDGLWRRNTRSRPGSWLAYAAARHPAEKPLVASEVSAGLTACDDADISAPPPEGTRYAVHGPNNRIAYLPNFRDAIGAAGSGPLHAWINGAWFTSREARTPAI
jgi:hypothetical protein